MDLSDALDEELAGGGCNPGWSGAQSGGGGPWPGNQSRGGGGPWPGNQSRGGGGPWPGNQCRGGGGPWPGAESGGGGPWPGSKSGDGGPWPAGQSGGGGSRPKGQSGGGGGQSGGGWFEGNQSGGGGTGPKGQSGDGFGLFGGGGTKGGQPDGGWFGGGSSPAPGPSSQRSLKVPYRVVLPNGCHDKLVITITGTINNNADKFTVDMCSSKDIAFHFNPRFNDCGQKVIVMNNCCSKKWGREERVSQFPFVQGQHFEMKMYCTRSGFEVKVDGKSIANFRHRARDVTCIKQINIYNDLTLTKVETE